MFKGETKEKCSMFKGETKLFTVMQIFVQICLERNGGLFYLF